MGGRLDPNLPKVDFAAGDAVRFPLPTANVTFLTASQDSFLKNMTPIVIVFTVAIMLKVCLTLRK